MCATKATAGSSSDAGRILARNDNQIQKPQNFRKRSSALQRRQQIPRRMLAASSLGMTIKYESRRTSEGEALRYKGDSRFLTRLDDGRFPSPLHSGRAE